MNKRTAKKIGEHMNYCIGFSGKGPTLLDSKPKTRLGRKERLIFTRMMKQAQAIKDLRWQSMRQAMIDVLGEDPDEDWD